ncbi:MAG: PQQ-binding-like beta-propeller repeat protein [Gemmatimonadaceae bacterium]|nr:PQQ-binding-like beta-propeller repeat protein [Gemmatimonadaceae bacterium]
MARTKSGPMVIGIGGHAVRIDASTGNEVWRTKLKTTSFTTVMVEDGRVYAGAGGELFCLDLRTGEILWRNKLKGLGMGVIAFSGASDAAVQAANQQQQRAAIAAAT